MKKTCIVLVSKRFITKVMFLAVVARLRFDADQNVMFSRKIGIFPFTYKELAKRRRKNRVASTLETKTMINVNKDVSRSYLIEKVLPAIRSKWPRCSAIETIYIQQNNAKPRIQGWDAEFLEAANQEGFDIRLLFQPQSSLDMNVLDLGFFRAIQSLQYQASPKIIVDELVHALEKSFEDLSPESLKRVFLTLQASMIEGNLHKASVTLFGKPHPLKPSTKLLRMLLQSSISLRVNMFEKRERERKRRKVEEEEEGRRKKEEEEGETGKLGKPQLRGRYGHIRDAEYDSRIYLNLWRSSLQVVFRNLKIAWDALLEFFQLPEIVVKMAHKTWTITIANTRLQPLPFQEFISALELEYCDYIVVAVSPLLSFRLWSSELENIRRGTING
ncbi:hypothetical protein Vadar_020143 [Vaccinium darrowii]|uniref:Uncharacterized protein n=1 Tax=Vaccinium darrowii TaxID=229202 RepID=A0ACB7Y8I7_9ERIC|nr:hypothetical protein Vadar_020143 [Vaccinium darrowii]